MLFGEDEATALIAKALALHSFRHPLEDLHAGSFPVTEKGDFSDVKVVTPCGEIPWSKLSRISDEEMRSLMIEVVDVLYTLLSKIDDQLYRVSLLVQSHEFTETWREPNVEREVLDAFTNHERSFPRGLVERMIAVLVESDIARKKAQNNMSEA